MIITSHEVDEHKILSREEKQKLVNATWKALSDAGRIDELGLRYRIGDALGNIKKCEGAFKGQTVYACAAGPSIDGFDFSLLDGKLSIGCNHMIETYDKFTWFIFQDQRFMERTSYDLHKYNGLIFAHNHTNMEYEEYPNLMLFKSAKKPRTYRDGIYARHQTGIAVLHLAVISGASKIYLLGHDNPASWDFEKQGRMHGIPGYTGEQFFPDAVKETAARLADYEPFRPWASRIVNVCENGYLQRWFQSITMEEFKKELAA